MANPIRKLTEWATKITRVRFREAYGVQIDDDEDQWRSLTGHTRRDLTPMTQERMRETAYYAWERNVLARAMIELPLAYLLGEGVRLTVDDEEHQEVLDRFWKDPINAMDLKLKRKVRELMLFGEQAWPSFVNDVNGHVRLGYLDPAMIERVVVDPENAEQPIGIETKKNTKGEYKQYRIIVNGAEDDLFTANTRSLRENFQDGDVFFFQINTLVMGRRGRSDLLAQLDWMDLYEQFLFGEAERGNFLRAFLWDVTLRGATPDDVKDRAKKIERPKPGSVRVHNDSEEWQALTPSLNAEDSQGSARLFRNHILGGSTFPEHWFGGAADVNRATSESMSEPTFKALSSRQRELKYMLETVGLYVLRQYTLHSGGSEPEFNDPRFAVEAIFPELSRRDITSYAAAMQQIVAATAIAVDRGFLTDRTAIQLIGSIAAQLGIEIDVENELEAAQESMARKQGMEQEGDLFVGANPVDDDVPRGT